MLIDFSMAAAISPPGFTPMIGLRHFFADFLHSLLPGVSDAD